MMSYLPEGFLINTAENKYYLSSLENFCKAHTDGVTLEARVTCCDCHHNLHIDFGFIKGIIPREECAMGIKEGTIRDIAIISRVNKPVVFTIEKIDFADGEKTAYLSRRSVQEAFTQNRLSQLMPGDVIDAKITHLVGTWEENAASFKVGETVSGIIRSIESYGVFVELTPNLSGLAEYTDSVDEGDYASIYIKSIIPEKMKFKLIIVDSFKAEYTKEKPIYFINDNHIDYFRYSPEKSLKIIETVF